MSLRRKHTVRDSVDKFDEVGHDAGFTLVEIIMTMAIMAIVMIPLMDAVVSNIRASAGNTNRAVVETTIQNAADRVNRAPLACDYKLYAQAAAQSQGWQADRATTTLKQWQASSGSWVASTCVDAPSSDTIQLVTITMSSPDGKINRTIQVVKSRV
jgi:prepilin-type N-terminal cleavage/methylation domain-containing protein